MSTATTVAIVPPAMTLVPPAVTMVPSAVTMAPHAVTTDALIVNLLEQLVHRSAGMEPWKSTVFLNFGIQMTDKVSQLPGLITLVFLTH